ncbi:Phosphoserine phosphatase 1 [Planctomycetes bacterium Pla163]|uniref:Phosphoserine phosphatase 1 n=1 Tax=Rohdeia mirabilis TaxID=2528008 RepID=A0A518D0J7_9BACT|nr:Phosphoserine phosphatase 1 [Planctomycetes bacterium Pla163]
MSTDATTRLYLIRHGEVDPAWRGRIYGGLEVELSEFGRREAFASAACLAGLPLDGVLTSTLSRAQFTAQLLAEPRGLEPRDHVGLVELDRGDWAGLTFDELESRDPGAHERWLAAPDRERPTNGESLADLAERVRAALQESIRPDVDRTLAVTAHGWVVRVLLCEALGLPLSRAEDLRMRTASIHAIEWRDGRPSRLLGLDLDGPLAP